MPLPYRFVEACALLPMLHVDRVPPNTIYCVGPQAEMLAKDVLRWRDVARVYLDHAPLALRHPNIVIGAPPSGSCTAVLLSPEIQPDPYIFALAKTGVICASTQVLSKVEPLMRHMRQLFPRSIVPWREYLLPEVIYGALASPNGPPKRIRQPPGGAIRLSEKYIPCLFTFAADETPLVFGPPADKKAPQPQGATRG